ncbi:MAG: EF-hand domain-containing protein [Solirubrobacterales bacterium]|nr:EF-hand domain-containing protein [Solirubrobacterales bacterium]
MRTPSHRVGLVGFGFVVVAVLGAAALIVPASSSQAAQAARGSDLQKLLRRSFLAADRNHDGYIDQREARMAIDADFKSMDVDHDGVLSLRDIRKGFAQIKRPAAVVPNLAYYFPFHRGRGGAVRLAEYQRAMLARVKGMDANHDGRYSWLEGRSFYARHLGVYSRAPAGRVDGIPGPVAAALVLPAFGLLTRLRRWRRALILLLALLLPLVALAVAVPNRAAASAVYNNASRSYGVAFVCGFFCGAQFTVDPGGDWGWPGEAGTYIIFDLKAGCEGDDKQVGVPDHGFSVLLSTGAGVKDLVWDDWNSDTSSIVRGVKIVTRPFGSFDCQPF